MNSTASKVLLLVTGGMMTLTGDLRWHLAFTILWTTSLVLGDSIPGPNNTSLALHCSAWREAKGGESREE